MEELTQYLGSELCSELNRKIDDISESVERHHTEKTQPSLNATAISLLHKQHDFILSLASLPQTSNFQEKIWSLKNQMIEMTTLSIEHAHTQGDVTLINQMKELLVLLKRVIDALTVRENKSSAYTPEGNEDTLWRRLVDSPHDRQYTDVDRAVSPGDDVKTGATQQVAQQQDTGHEESRQGRKRNKLRKMGRRNPAFSPNLETPIEEPELNSFTDFTTESTDVDRSSFSDTQSYGCEDENSDYTTTGTTDPSTTSELPEYNVNHGEDILLDEEEATPQGKQAVLPPNIDSGMVPDISSSASIYSDQTQTEVTTVASSFLSAEEEDSILCNVFDGVDIHLSPSDSSLHSFASFYSDYTHHEDESFRVRSRHPQNNPDDYIHEEPEVVPCAAVSFASDASSHFVELKDEETESKKSMSPVDIPIDVSTPKAAKKHVSSCDVVKSLMVISLVLVAALAFSIYMKATGAAAVFDYYTWWELLYKHTDVTKSGDPLF